MAYFDEYDVMFSNDGKVLERCPESFEGSYEVPFGVEDIGEIAFKNCTGLTELTLPRTIKTLKAGAFEGVKSLARLNYEGSLDEWFDVTILCYLNSSHTFFVDGEQLTEVVIPKTRTIIPKRAFYYVHGLNTVVFHDEIIEIDDYAFNKSSISGRIVLPPKLKRIGDYAFLSCQQMTGVSIPPTVQKIGEGAFRYCRKVSRYEAHDNPWYSHYGLDLCSADNKILLAVHNLPSAREFKVMREIETIPDYVFSSMPESVKEIKLPFGIKRIGKKAFEGYNGKIVIQDSKAELLDNIGIPRDRVIYNHDFDADFKESSSLLNLVSQNPYRVMGLGAGSSTEEINGRYVSMLVMEDFSGEPRYEGDVIPGLDNPVRTADSIQQAKDSLRTDLDRFVYSLFWVKNETDIQKKLLDVLVKYGNDIDNDWIDYETDLSFDSYHPIQLFLWDSFTVGLEEYLELVSSDNDDFFMGVVEEYIGTPHASFSVKEAKQRIMTILSNTIGKEQFIRYINSAYKFTAKWLAGLIEEPKKVDPYATIVKAIEDAKTAEHTIDSLKESAYRIFDIVDNNKESIPEDLLYECGEQMITNLREAILLSSDRKLRLNLVYDMDICRDYLRSKDKSASYLNDAIAKVKEPLDVIPPYDFIEQDCSIYESMISWILCTSIQGFLNKFWPIVKPLSEVYLRRGEDDNGVIRVISKRRYFQEESDLIAEMGANNIVRIVSTMMERNKDGIINQNDARELSLAYSLLMDFNKILNLSAEVKNKYTSPATQSIYAILSKKGIKPFYLGIFKLQSEDDCWKEALNNSSNLLKYLNIYGTSGKYSMLAQTQLKQFENNDEQMWKSCKTLANYEAYVKNSPTCSHKLEAEQIIEKKRKTIWIFTWINFALIISAIIIFAQIMK